MKTIAIMNQKGGTGKTTSAINLAGELVRRGKKVLIVDMDTQGNATSNLELTEVPKITLSDIIVDKDHRIPDAICHTSIEGLDLIRGGSLLAPALASMQEMPFGRDMTLKRLVPQIPKDYDFVFFDCSPSLGYTTVNILTAADTVLIPVQCEYLALEGLSKLLNTIRIVKNGLNPALEIEGFVLTMYMRNRLNNQVVNEVRNHFGELAFDTIIQRNIRLGEAPSHGKPVILYDASAVGSANYLTLAKELLKRNRKSNQKAK